MPQKLSQNQQSALNNPMSEVSAFNISGSHCDFLSRSRADLSADVQKSRASEQEFSKIQEVRASTS